MVNKFALGCSSVISLFNNLVIQLGGSGAFGAPGVGALPGHRLSWEYWLSRPAIRLHMYEHRRESIPWPVLPLRCDSSWHVQGAVCMGCVICHRGSWSLHPIDVAAFGAIFAVLPVALPLPAAVET